MAYALRDPSPLPRHIPLRPASRRGARQGGAYADRL